MLSKGMTAALATLALSRCYEMRGNPSREIEDTLLQDVITHSFARMMHLSRGPGGACGADVASNIGLTFPRTYYTLFQSSDHD